MKKSSLFISKYNYIKEKKEFSQNIDFIHQNYNNDIEINNIYNKEKDYVKVKHIKGKR